MFVGHQSSGLGEHYVLHPRRTFLLGLDVLRHTNRGMQFPLFRAFFINICSY